MTAKTVLIAALRNEGPFLLDWVAHHRALGVSEILLFTDRSEDASAELAAALAGTAGIAAYDNAGPGGHRQRAYDTAMGLPVVQGADWVMALDTDEYLNIHEGAGRLADLIGAAEEAGADLVSLCWRLFGHGGHVAFEDAPVTARFTRAAPRGTAVLDRQYGLKTLFRPAIAAGMGPHRPVIAEGADIRWIDGAGRDVTETLRGGGWKAGPEGAGYDLGQINHYMIRGAEAFALHHFSAPPLTGEPQPLGLADFAAFNTNHESDTTIARMAGPAAAERARLVSDPAVAAAHDRAVAAWRDRIAALRERHAGRPDSPVVQLLDPRAAREAVPSGAAQETADDPAPAAEAADMAPRWLADLRRSAHRRGWYHSDETFAVQFTDRGGEVLVVSFDNLSSVNDPSLARDTWGYGFYAAEGWSHMGVLSFARNWYRDEALFDLMEAQQGLFARFGTVVMTGTSMGAYAATAFADLAPGCTVLAFSPQATLDEARVPWEERFNAGRKQDWSGRYAFAPDHCRAARDVFVIHDPYFGPDRRHAELYRGPNVHLLKSWYASHKSAMFMRRAEILKDTMLAAVAGTLDPARYYEMFRARRDLVWYYNGLADHALARGHTGLAARLADHLAAQGRPGLAQGIRARL